MCGVTGIYTPTNMGLKLYSNLSKIQHRGQDCWGVTNGTKVLKYKGLIKNNYCYDDLVKMDSGYGIGHTRYLTQGKMTLEQTQPFLKNNISLVHNGNIINTEEIKKLLGYSEDAIYSDSQLLLDLLCFFYDKQNNIVSSIVLLQETCKGSFFVIALIYDCMVCFKDNNAIRPGVWFRDGTDIVVSSENCGLTNNVNDVLGGEIVVITKTNVKTYNGRPDIKPCIFEYIYLAHPASKLYNVNVYDFRVQLASKLAELINVRNDIDYVSTIPDSSRIYAIEIAKKLNLEYKEVIIKNNYSIRTFIMPDEIRQKNINKKFFFIESQIKNKTIMIVDDSIVRGTTSKYVIRKLKELGVKKIIMVSCAPVVKNCNCYGIKIDSKKELLSYNKSVDDMKTYLGCDELVFQSLKNLYEIIPFKQIEDSIFL